jgi:hypothetical protein
MNSVARYLYIPPAYADWLGGLHWSCMGEVLEFHSGDTFALRQEVAAFVEGFGANRRLIHFAHFLHLMHLLGYGKGKAHVMHVTWLLGQGMTTVPPERLDFCRAFLLTGKNLRNAGALCAVLCADVPPIAASVHPSEVCLHLNSGPLMAILMSPWAQEQPPTEAEAPLLEPAVFEAQVLQALKQFTFEELEHWFDHGRGPLKEEGEQIARELPLLQPRPLAGVLESLTQRGRLAGAAPFVPQLVSALALPPRRLAQRELPVGGYADVTTRGHPEQLLPTQFAVDSLEFVRRFAENELLYFRREEPPTRVQEELIVLLDQGVRTWGEVRLILSAAVLALGKLAARKEIPFRVATTSSPRICDPLQMEEHKLGELLEASDLSVNPGLALERVLEEPTTAARDVVLLTHPRNLREEDVSAAARRVAAGTRLFTVSVDEPRNVRFCELRHGRPIRLSEFHAEPRRTPAPPAHPQARHASPLTPWRGAIEPVPFPFLFGINGKILPQGFVFDQAAEWLLVASQHGVLHAFRLDGSRAEVLPRGMTGKGVLKKVDAILGVTGGFVVAGGKEQLTAVHYDFPSRTVTVYELGVRGSSAWRWYYFPALHSVVVRSKSGAYAVDLATGYGPMQKQAQSPFSPRAARALIEAQDNVLPPPFLHVFDPDLAKLQKGPLIDLNLTTGTVTLTGVSPAWERFTPLADGQPMLKGCAIVSAQLQGSTLAVMLRRFGTRDPHTLRVFRGPEGVLIWETAYPPNVRTDAPFALSSDGRFLAVPLLRYKLQVRDLQEAGVPVLTTPTGKYHDRLDVMIGKSWMGIRLGNLCHLLCWNQTGLQWTLCRKNAAAHMLMQLAAAHLQFDHQETTPEQRPNLVDYDFERFVSGLRSPENNLAIAVDAFGQIAVFEYTGKLLCMFFVFREKLAAWMPDGTCHGPTGLLGRQATPNALEKIGLALHNAAHSAKKVSP